MADFVEQPNERGELMGEQGHNTSRHMMGAAAGMALFAGLLATHIWWVPAGEGYAARRPVLLSRVAPVRRRPVVLLQQKLKQKDRLHRQEEQILRLASDHRKNGRLVYVANQRELWSFHLGTGQKHRLLSMPEKIIGVVMGARHRFLYVELRTHLRRVRFRRGKVVSEFLSRKRKRCFSMSVRRRVLYCCPFGFSPSRGCHRVFLSGRERKRRKYRVLSGRRFGKSVFVGRWRLRVNKRGSSFHVAMRFGRGRRQHIARLPGNAGMMPAFVSVPHHRALLAFVADQVGDMSVCGRAWALRMGQKPFAFGPKPICWEHGKQWHKADWEWSPDGRWLALEGILTDLRQHNVSRFAGMSPVWVRW